MYQEIRVRTVTISKGTIHSVRILTPLQMNLLLSNVVMQRTWLTLLCSHLKGNQLAISWCLQQTLAKEMSFSVSIPKIGNLVLICQAKSIALSSPIRLEAWSHSNGT